MSKFRIESSAFDTCSIIANFLPKYKGKGGSLDHVPLSGVSLRTPAHQSRTLLKGGVGRVNTVKPAPSQSNSYAIRAIGHLSCTRGNTGAYGSKNFWDVHPGCYLLEAADWLWQAAYPSRRWKPCFEFESFVNEGDFGVCTRWGGGTIWGACEGVKGGVCERVVVGRVLRLRVCSADLPEVE